VEEGGLKAPKSTQGRPFVKLIKLEVCGDSDQTHLGDLFVAAGIYGDQFPQRGIDLGTIMRKYPNQFPFGGIGRHIYPLQQKGSR
jgi:hypothetical protein